MVRFYDGALLVFGHQACQLAERVEEEMRIQLLLERSELCLKQRALKPF